MLTWPAPIARVTGHRRSLRTSLTTPPRALATGCQRGWPSISRRPTSPQAGLSAGRTAGGWPSAVRRGRSPRGCLAGQVRSPRRCRLSAVSYRNLPLGARPCLADLRRRGSAPRRRPAALSSSPIGPLSAPPPPCRIAAWPPPASTKIYETRPSPACRVRCYAVGRQAQHDRGQRPEQARHGVDDGVGIDGPSHLRAVPQLALRLGQEQAGSSETGERVHRMVPLTANGILWPVVSASRSWWRRSPGTPARMTSSRMAFIGASPVPPAAHSNGRLDAKSAVIVPAAGPRISQSPGLVYRTRDVLTQPPGTARMWNSSNPLSCGAHATE